MKYYKLTNQNNETRNGTRWGQNVTHRAIGAGKKLCTADVIHVYDHPFKAVMFNPIQANFTGAQLWACRVKRVVANDGLKVGVKECTTIKKIPLPEISLNAKVHFAILCALTVYHEPSFIKWANNWLNNKNRAVAEVAAWAAAGAAGAAAGAAGAAADAVAAWAASWAAGAAGAAARAAEAAGAASRAAEAAGAASRAAEAAGAASRAAEAANKKIDFISLIKKAIKAEAKLSEG